MGVIGASAADYLRLLQGLLPPGAAWPREDDAHLTQLMQAWADELARVDARAAELLEEADPRLTSELLTEWETLCGLPSPGAPPAQTDAQRRADVVGRLAAVGGQSRGYFQALAEAFGYPGARVVEYFPFRAGSPVGQAMANVDGWRHTWRIQAEGLSGSPRHFRVGDPVGGPLTDWGDDWYFACRIYRYKPAHSILHFGYGEGGDA